jgi:hypothetical protein
MKVVLVTPAGRRRYLSLLTRHTGRCRHLAVRHELWRNTDDEEDIRWMYRLAAKDDFFHVIEPTWELRGAFSIAPFFRGCIDPDTVYIRLDDDIVYLAPDAIENMIEFRLAYPEYLLVFGNVINSGIGTHILQRLGKLPLDHGIVGYHCMDATGWGDPKFAEWLHRHFLKVVHFIGSLDCLKFTRWELMYAKQGVERVSINFISWLGSTFKTFHGLIDADEENFLNGPLPLQLQMNSAICGTAIAAHFAFYSQRDYLDATDVLTLYDRLA